MVRKLAVLIFCLIAGAASAGWPNSGQKYPQGISIAVPTVILSSYNTAVTSGVATAATSADAPAGSLVCLVVSVQANSAATVSSVTDTATGGSNSYSQIVSKTGGGGFQTTALWCSVTTHDLPSSSTFTATLSNGALSYSPFGFYSNATAGTDQTNSGNCSTCTTVSLATGSLAQAAELVIANLEPDNAPGTYTEASGFTSLNPSQNATFGDIAYQITSSTSAVTFAPSWTNSRNPTVIIASFK